MPDDGDLALAKLAVEAGYLSREAASHYWRQIQSPGSPRLVQVLMRDGQLTPPQVERLRSMYWERQQRGGGSPASPPPEPHQTMLPDGDASESHFISAEEAWEEALELDTEMARVLLNKGLVSRAQLRECREIQIKHQVRLGDILVRRGYVDAGTVEATLDTVQDAPIALSRGGPPPGPPQHKPFPAPSSEPRPPSRVTQPLSAAEIVSAGDKLFPQAPVRAGPSLFESEPSPPPLPSSGRVTPGMLEQSSGGAHPPPRVDQDEAPTVVGAPAVKRRQRRPSDETIPAMGRSVDELNPFAGMEGGLPPGARERSDDSLDIIMEPSPRGAPGGGHNARLDRANSPTRTDDDFPAPEPKLPMHSVDELDAFTDFFRAAEAGSPGDSQSATVEKDMSEAASADAEAAWAEASDGWGPGPGFDDGPGAPPGRGGSEVEDAWGSGGDDEAWSSGGDASWGQSDGYDSEATEGGPIMGYGDPIHQKLIESEDIPPRAPMGAAAYPDEGSEHPPAPLAPPAWTPPRPKRGGKLKKLLKALGGLLILAGVGVGAYFAFRYFLQ